LFTEKSVNQRTEDALPLLARLQQMAEEQGVDENTGVTDYSTGYNPGPGGSRNELLAKYAKTKDPKDADAAFRMGATEQEVIDARDKMQEVNEFEDWADNIVEGTWAVPETPKQLRALKLFLSKEQPLGIDAMNVSDVLYDIIGDDDLYDLFSEIAEREPESDARPIVINWIRDAVKDLDFVNPNVVKNLRKVIQGVKEGFEGDLDADSEDDLNARFNKDMDTNVRQESTKKDTEMKPFTEYVAEAEADEIEEVVETEVEDDAEVVDEAEETETKEWKKPWEKDDKEEDDKEDDKEEVSETGAPLVAMNDQNDLGSLMQRTNYLLNK